MIKKQIAQMHVKKGDKVQVISGKHKGKTGNINKIDKKTQKVFINEVNIVKKHKKPRNTQEPGKIVNLEAPLHCSNVKKIL